jgi:hypothetical protein
MLLVDLFLWQLMYFMSSLLRVLNKHAYPVTWWTPAWNKLVDAGMAAEAHLCTRAFRYARVHHIEWEYSDTDAQWGTLCLKHGFLLSLYVHETGGLSASIGRGHTCIVQVVYP